MAGIYIIPESRIDYDSSMKIAHDPVELVAGTRASAIKFHTFQVAREAVSRIVLQAPVSSDHRIDREK